MTAYIPLTNGQFAVVSLEDLATVIEYSWYARRDRSGYYACSSNNLRMHKLICAGQIVDHVNRNTLDNRRDNLRPVNTQQSALNRSRKNAEGFKGVSYTRGRYQARLSVDGINIHLGMFGTALEAALAYDRALHEWAGEYGSYNF